MDVGADAGAIAEYQDVAKDVAQDAKKVKN
jgi:hypothetical protein